MIPSTRYPNRYPMGMVLKLTGLGKDFNHSKVKIVSNNGDREWPYVVQPVRKSDRKALGVQNLFVTHQNLEGENEY